MGGSSVSKLTVDVYFEAENTKRMKVFFISFDVVDLRPSEKLFAPV